MMMMMMIIIIMMVMQAHTDILGVKYERDDNRHGTPSDYGKQLMIGRVAQQDQILYQVMMMTIMMIMMMIMMIIAVIQSIFELGHPDFA